MTNYSPAFDSIKSQYDIDTLRDIVKHGCVSGVANNHIYYTETVQFFDDNEEEIVSYIEDNLGTETLIEMFTNSDAHLASYKNDVCWMFIELVADQLIFEFESTTNEELSDLDEDVYPNLVELSNTEWGKDHLELVSL